MTTMLYVHDCGDLHQKQTNKQDKKLAFTKTREQQTSTSARFSVSMGIMPDYSYAGSGVRVDGVSENRPAKKAGILTGDIVKQLGEHKTSSVESYMQALSTFKRGDKTTTVVLRGDKEISFEIIFFLEHSTTSLKSNGLFTVRMF